MLKIDQYAYIGRLKKVHPAEKCGLSVLTMIVCLSFSSPVTSLLVILLMSGLIVFLAGIPARFFLRLMLVPMSFIIMGALTVALVFTGDQVSLLWGFQIGGYVIGVTTPGLAKAGELFLRSMGAVSCLYFLSLTTPMVEVLMLLKKLRLPPLLIELMSLVYRFIFVLLDTADKIYTSQASRWGYGTLKTSYYSLGQLLSNLFAKSYHNSRMLYMTLVSRCYTGELNVLENDYEWSRRNLLLIALTVLMLAATGWWSVDSLSFY